MAPDETPTAEQPAESVTDAPAPDASAPEPEAPPEAPPVEPPAPDAPRIEVDESSAPEDIAAAAAQRNIEVPEGTDPGAVLKVIEQVDAAVDANATGAGEGTITAETVEREAAYANVAPSYTDPDYAVALEQGFYGTPVEDAPVEVGAQQRQSSKP